MRDLRSQEGSMLVLLIGVIAALAIMASTLVMLTGNVQSNTAQERTRSKAFDVAEGGLDYYMNQMALGWPKGVASPPAFNSAAFRGLDQFNNPSEYPNPAGGAAFANVTVYDNDQTVNGKVNEGYSVAASPHTDANGDGKVWLVATGATGRKAAGIQVKVNRTPVNTQFPKGIAVYAGGNMTSNGGGNNPKITVEDSGGPGNQVHGYVKGTIDTVTVFDQSSANPVIPSVGSLGQYVPPLSDLIPDSMVNQIIALAQTLGRYYDTTQGASLPADKTGLCVIRVADGTTVDLGNNGGINSLESPGILMILGPEGGSGNAITLDMGGNQDFWGVLYTDGRFKSSHGTPDIHGMVICKSNMDMKGTPGILYNASVIANLANQWTLTVNQVPNTWRELRPTPAP